MKQLLKYGSIPNIRETSLLTTPKAELTMSTYILDVKKTKESKCNRFSINKYRFLDKY